MTSEQAIKQIDSEYMQYLLFSRKTLQSCVPEIFSRLGLLERFNIPRDKLVNLTGNISKNMKRVPYHNFTHAFNIMHMCYIIMTRTRVRDYLEDIDVLSMMVAALSHDLDHPGFNNVYFQKLRLPIA